MSGFKNEREFFSCPVKDYLGPADWDGPEVAYRVGRGALESLVQQRDAPLLRALLLNAWGGNGDDLATLQSLIQAREQLDGLLAVLLGDLDREPRKRATAPRVDLSPLLDAFPSLELLRVRGGQITFSKIQNFSLRALIVETHGLPRSALHAICGCNFPNLAHLELWLGSSKHGWDGSVADLQAIMDGLCFPALNYLGLKKSDIADEIASAVVDAPVLEFLSVLDLSNGNLSDHGGHALLDIPWNVRLRDLVVRNNYLTPAMVQRLDKELPCRLITQGSRDFPDDAD